MGGDTHPPAAAAAKSIQSCPTLCDPIDGSPPGSPIPGILQARTVDWGAIAFSHPPAAASKLTMHWFPIVRLHSVCVVSNRGSHFSAKTLLLILNLLPPLNPVPLSILSAKFHFPLIPSQGLNLGLLHW